MYGNLGLYLCENLADYHLLEGDWLWRAGGKCFDERPPDSWHVSTRLDQTHHTAHIAVSMTTADVRRTLMPTPLSRTHVWCFSNIAETTTTTAFYDADFILYDWFLALQICAGFYITTYITNIAYLQLKPALRSHRPF